MLAITHLAIGAAATALCLETSDPMLLAIGALASLMPDMDCSASPIGRLVGGCTFALSAGKFNLSAAIEHRWAHRGPTHSALLACLLFVVVRAVAIWRGWPVSIFDAIACGWILGGIVPDCCTPAGAQILWPVSSLPASFPSNRDYRIRTGSNVELMLLAGIVAALLWIFTVNGAGGLQTWFGERIGSLQGLEGRVNQIAQTHEVIFEVTGLDAATRSPVSGTYALVAPMGRDYLVVDGDRDRLLVLGNSGSANVVPEKTDVRAGRSLRIDRASIVLDDEPIGPALVNFYESHSDPSPASGVWLSGRLSLQDADTLLLPERPGEFSTFSKSPEGNSVSLTHAPIKAVYDALGEQWATGTLTARLHYVR